MHCDPTYLKYRVSYFGVCPIIPQPQRLSESRQPPNFANTLDDACSSPSAAGAWNRLFITCICGRQRRCVAVCERSRRFGPILGDVFDDRLSLGDPRHGRPVGSRHSQRPDSVVCTLYLIAQWLARCSGAREAALGRAIGAQFSQHQHVVWSSAAWQSQHAHTARPLFSITDMLVCCFLVRRVARQLTLP